MRIRTIKPEFWASEGVASVPVEARLMFIGLWQMADDHGNGKANPLLVKAALFPLDDDISPEYVAGWMDDLEEAGLIQRYEVEGRTYLHVSAWDKHQAAAYRRGDPQHPAPTDVQESAPRISTVELESAGREGKGTGKGREGILAPNNGAVVLVTNQQAMFGAVCEVMGYDLIGLGPDDEREIGGIAAALVEKGLPPDQLLTYVEWLTSDQSPIVGGRRLTLHSIPKWVKDWRAVPRVVTNANTADRLANVQRNLQAMQSRGVTA